MPCRYAEGFVAITLIFAAGLACVGSGLTVKDPFTGGLGAALVLLAAALFRDELQSIRT